MAESIPLPTTDEPLRAERCETCRFWYPTDGTETKTTEAECRRRAPALWNTTYDLDGERVGSVESNWPVIEAFEWCGEWQAKRGGP